MQATRNRSPDDPRVSFEELVGEAFDRVRLAAESRNPYATGLAERWAKKFILAARTAARLARDARARKRSDNDVL